MSSRGDGQSEKCLIKMGNFRTSAFVLTQEKAYPYRLHFKANKKNLGSSKKWYQGSYKQPYV